MLQSSTMNNKILLSLRGLLLVGVGTILFTVSRQSSNNLVLLFAALTMAAGLCGIMVANTNRSSPLRSGWLMIESGADIVLSLVAVYFYLKSDNLTIDFMTAFACFALAFCFLQIIYIFQIAQVAVSPNIGVMIARAITGLGYGIFAVVLLFMSSGNNHGSTTLINIIGAGPAIAGIATLLLGAKLFTIKVR